ncbi:unnamed protein product, partial [marine sediment metagenome]
SVISHNKPDLDELPALPYFSAGVDITDSDIFNPAIISILDSVIESNGSSGINTTLSETYIQNNKINNNDYGVSITETSECNSVLNNTFLNNHISVIDLHEDPYSTSLVGDNKSYHDDSQTGYVVEYGPGVFVPVKTGTLLSYPPVSTFSCENIEIIKPSVVLERSLKKSDSVIERLRERLKVVCGLQIKTVHIMTRLNSTHF